MEIKEITKYVYNGKEYNSLKAIKEEIHNTIGVEVIDKINKVCPPQKHKDLFKLLDVLCMPEVRSVLTECLNVTFERLNEDGYTQDYCETVNILDI
jgi:hypothetical protein